MRTSTTLSAVCLLGFFCSPTAGQGHGRVEPTQLSQRQQHWLNHFYLVHQKSLWKAIGLSPLQCVKVRICRYRLGGTAVRFVSDETHSAADVAAMNTSAAQLERLTDLGEFIAGLLTEEQSAKFVRILRARNYAPVEVTLRPTSIGLVYPTQRGRSGRQSLHRKAKVGKPYPIAPVSELVRLLTSFSDMSEAILDPDSDVRAVGIKALAKLEVVPDQPRRKATVANVLLRLARLDKGYRRYSDLMAALAKVVSEQNGYELLTLARNTSGKRLRAVVTVLCHAAPERAIEFGRAQVDDRDTFNHVVIGMMEYGSAAKPLLTKLNRLTGKKYDGAVRGALARIAMSEQPASSTGSELKPWQRDPIGQLRADNRRPVPAMTRSEWLKALRSDSYQVVANALSFYKHSRNSLQLDKLSRSQKSELVKLCYTRLENQRMSIPGEWFGRIFLKYADENAIPLFEDLVESKEERDRVFGLAGLMIHSRDKAVAASLVIESKPLGIHTIRDAAELVGPRALPTLEILMRKFKSWHSQRWIEGAIRELK